MSQTKPTPEAATAPTPRLLYIDSVEAGVARLIPAQVTADLASYAFPAALLPEGAREGDWIDLQVHKAAAPPQKPGEEDNAAHRARLGQADQGGDISL